MQALVTNSWNGKGVKVPSFWSMVRFHKSSPDPAQRERSTIIAKVISDRLLRVRREGESCRLECSYRSQVALASAIFSFKSGITCPAARWHSSTWGKPESMNSSTPNRQ